MGPSRGSPEALGRRTVSSDERIMLAAMIRGAKSTLKRPAARVLEVACRWSSRRIGLALCYHRIGDPEGDPERELVPALGAARFEAQVRHLRSRYRLVPAS